MEKGRGEGVTGRHFTWRDMGEGRGVEGWEEGKGKGKRIEEGKQGGKGGGGAGGGIIGSCCFVVL